MRPRRSRCAYLGGKVLFGALLRLGPLALFLLARREFAEVSQLPSQRVVQIIALLGGFQRRAAAPRPIRPLWSGAATTGGASPAHGALGRVRADGVDEGPVVSLQSRARRGRARGVVVERRDEADGPRREARRDACGGRLGVEEDGFVRREADVGSRRAAVNGDSVAGREDERRGRAEGDGRTRRGRRRAGHGAGLNARNAAGWGPCGCGRGGVWGSGEQQSLGPEPRNRPRFAAPTPCPCASACVAARPRSVDRDGRCR